MLPTVGRGAEIQVSTTADAGSVQFDRKMYSSGYANKKLLEEYAQWKNLSFYEKAVQAVSTRK